MPLPYDAVGPPTPPSQMHREGRDKSGLWGLSTPTAGLAHWEDLAVSLRQCESAQSGWTAPTPAPTPMKPKARTALAPNEEEEEEKGTERLAFVAELMKMLGDSSPRDSEAAPLSGPALLRATNTPAAAQEEASCPQRSAPAGMAQDSKFPDSASLVAGLTGFLSPHAEPPTPFSTPVAGRALLQGGHDKKPEKSSVARGIFDPEPTGLQMPPLLPMDDQPGEAVQVSVSVQPYAALPPHVPPPPPPLYTLPVQPTPPAVQHQAAPLHHMIEPPPLLDAPSRIQQVPAMSVVSTDGPLIPVFIEFKMGRLAKYDSPSSICEVPEGTYVIVKGDRGEHIGMVRRNVSPRRREGLDSEGLVLRLATPQEREHLKQHRQMEEEALRVCAQKVAETGLVMELCYAEYQFDFKKLTFFYRSETRQDFRDLIRDLYKLYRARIWMEKIKE